MRTDKVKPCLILLFFLEDLKEQNCKLNWFLLLVYNIGAWYLLYHRWLLFGGRIFQVFMFLPQSLNRAVDSSPRLQHTTQARDAWYGEFVLDDVMDVAFEVGKQREPAALLFAVDGSERDEGVVVVIDEEHDDESDDDVDRVVTTTGQ